MLIKMTGFFVFGVFMILYVASGKTKKMFKRELFLIWHRWLLGNRYSRQNFQCSGEKRQAGHSQERPPCPVSYGRDYLFYFVNAHGWHCFDIERDQVRRHLACRTRRFCIRQEKKTLWDGTGSRYGAWVVTRNHDSPYFYMGDIKNGRPHGIGAVYRKDSALAGIDSADILLMRGEFRCGVPRGYIQMYCFCGGLEYIVCCQQYKAETGTDWQSAVNAVLVHLTYEGYCRGGRPHGRGILYQQDSLSSIPHVIEAVQQKKYAVSMILDSVSQVSFTIGEFSGGRLQGWGSQYAGGHLFFEGLFFEGEKLWGNLYYADGQIQYKGMFKKGTYNGRGTSYRADGSVEYSGLWRNGDYHW